jgi:hypothetical protein
MNLPTRKTPNSAQKLHPITDLECTASILEGADSTALWSVAAWRDDRCMSLTSNRRQAVEDQSAAEPAHSNLVACF